jgi:P27 family predicted phage terminase small subunit
MDQKTKRVWRNVTELMATMGVLTKADLALVARYCESWVEWQSLRDFRKEKGLYCTLVSSKGVSYMAKYPEITRLEVLEAQLLRMEREIGFTPSTRSSLAITIKSKEDIEFDRYLAGECPRKLAS